MTAPAELDRLYQLLPALYRISDDEQDLVLQALLRLINSQSDQVRSDIRQLWDDFFIETCQRWVVPYIGDLVGNIPLHDADGADAATTAQELFPDLRRPDLAPANPVHIRADVANTIHYRRRKGTPAMLEELAHDVTGWDARVVEFFTMLGWNQHLEHLRPDAYGCADLRSVERCTRIDGPWDSAPHTVDVRAISQFEGWYGIPNIGFFLWRLRARPHTQVQARQIGQQPWRFTFNPLGQDTPLYARGNPQPDRRRIEPTVAAPIRPAAFGADLRSGPGGASAYYGEDGGDRIVVYLDKTAIPADQIACANLGDWMSFPRPDTGPIRIDVSRGRLILPKDRTGTVLVSYCDGFSGDLGGGQYTRGKWRSKTPPTATVAGGGAVLENAITTALAGDSPATPVIEIADNLTYHLDGPIDLKGHHLTIQAADQKNPHVLVTSPASALNLAGAGASLTLNGLLFEGGLNITGDLHLLRLLHCTLVPGRSVLPNPTVRPHGTSVHVAATDSAGTPINAKLQVQLSFSVVGAMRVPSTAVRLWVLDSIVDGVTDADTPKGVAIGDPGGRGGPPGHIERSTILGAAQFSDLDLASESIFAGQVFVRRRQSGCVRFSYIGKPPTGRADSCRWTVSGLGPDTANLGNKTLDAI